MTKVNLVKDQIHINKKPTPSPFEVNPLPAQSNLVLPYHQMFHSESISQNKSYFQGHIVKVRNLDEATAARNSIFQNYKNEHHITYAYTVNAGIDGKKPLQGHSDDREISGTKKLNELIVENELLNIFLCVTRVKNGSNIGPVRFDLIDEAAKLAYELYDSSSQPVFLSK